MKPLILILLTIALSPAHAQTENTEIGVSTNSQLSFTFPSTFAGNLSADVSQAISDSKTYQVGALTTFQLTSTTSVLKIAATATIHFTEESWRNAWFIRPILGWERDTYGSIPVSGFIYGMQIGKRFAITDQLVYRPQVEFSRDAYNNPQVILTLLGLSYFISFPQIF